MSTSVFGLFDRFLSANERIPPLDFRHDQRISSQRWSDVDAHGVANPGGGTVSVDDARRRATQIVQLYYRDRLCNADPPDYVNRSKNGYNFVPVATGSGRSGVLPYEPMVHLLDLAAQHDAFLNAETNGVRSFRFYSRDVRSRKDLPQWLAERMPQHSRKRVPGRSEAQLEYFVRQLLEAVFDYQRKSREPTWLAKLAPLIKHIAQGPNRWMQALGMWDSSRRTGERFPMILVRPVNEIGRLIWPTRLESPNSQWHFPSPPAAPLDDGGYAVDRRNSPGAAALVSEYIHEPIRWTWEDWDLGGHGRWSGMTNSTARAGALELPGARRQHYRRLLSRFPNMDRNWMRDTTCLA